MHPFCSIALCALLIYCISMVNLFNACFKRTCKPSKTKDENPIAAVANDLTALENKVGNNTALHASSTSDSRPYALLIGIDDYPKLTKLKGAVADANDMESFLISNLNVPIDRIINLRNDTASRTRIIQAFQELQDDPRIKRGDPILIYYAGHGGLRKAEADWKAKYGADEVQVIFPFDYGVPISGSESIKCIPDKTVAALLNELAEAKGDNITVIFDSCHSASGNRDDETEESDSGGQARSAEIDFDVPCNIDDDILQPHMHSLGGTRGTEPLLCIDQTSHVYLAACGSDQKAREENGRGVFTVALLKAMREHIGKITYRNLIISLPVLPRQSPHCYGLNQSRILFNACVPSRKTHFIPVKFEQRIPTLLAGLASDVTPGSVWELHEFPTDDSPVLGRFCVEDAGDSTAVLEPQNADEDKRFSVYVPSKTNQDDDIRLYARLIRYGPGCELKVYFSPEAKLCILPETEVGSIHIPDGPRSNEHQIGYVIHPTRQGADIAVGLCYPREHGAEPEAVFYLCNSQAEKYGVAELKDRKPARRDEVETVLFAAAKWNRHLHRTNPTTRDKVTLEMMKIAEKIRSRPNVIKSMLQPYVNLNQAGVAEIDAHEKDLYGFRLTSRVNAPLYVRMFYFDATNFSIGDMFGHSTANVRPDCELPKSGELMIGDRGDGGAPHKFSLSSGNETELAYLKVFWSIDPLECDLEQELAFKMKKGDSRAWTGRDEDEETREWGTVILTLVMHKPAGGA